MGSIFEASERKVVLISYESEKFYMLWEAYLRLLKEG